jgi:hypothetical protein
VTGVSSVYVHDNDTTGTVDGVPAGTVHVSVIGGASADIAKAIDDIKTPTIPTHGSQSVVVYNSVTKKNKTIYFDIGAEVPIYIAINITPISGLFPNNGSAQIKSNLVSHFLGYQLSDDITYDIVKAQIYLTSGIILNSFYISKTDPPGGTSDISMTALQKPTLALADIDITES